MLTCFTEENGKKIIPITTFSQNQFPEWFSKQNEDMKNWLNAIRFRANPRNFCLIPDEKNNISQVICCITNFWDVGNLSFNLPEGIYEFTDKDPQLALAWGLGAYRFTQYKKLDREPAQLFFQNQEFENMIESIYFVRDLINTPTDDLGPSELAKITANLAKEHQASFKEIVGDDLLKQNYAAIHTVGRASDDAPRLLELMWGNQKHFKVTLVGKGVCFDSGGLNLKNAAGMQLMKKDMGGAAHVLGLARMIMQAKLPIYLRVLIPAVENVISGNAYRPGDIIKSRKGISIEIGNTDAEGRVILADALTEAASQKPDLIIDIATLTGAARVALGTDLPALFCNQENTAEAVIRHANNVSDPLWRLPLFSAYRENLMSSIADLSNDTKDSYAGAIHAALFLKEFIPDEIPWMHLDLMAWNLKSRSGRPEGGEAMALRGLFSYLTHFTTNLHP